MQQESPVNSPDRFGQKIAKEWASWLSRMLQLALAIGLIYLILRWIDLAELSHVLQRIAWSFLLIGTLFFFLGMLLRALLFQTLLNAEAALFFFFAITMLRRFLGSLFFGLGDASFALLAKRYLHVDLAESVANLLLARTIEGLALIPWAVLTALFIAEAWLWWGIAITAIVALLPAGVMVSSQGIIPWVHRIQDFSFVRSHKRLLSGTLKLLEWLTSYQQAQAEALSSQRKLWLGCLIGVAAGGSAFFYQWLVCRSLGLLLTFWQATAMILMLSALSNLPIYSFGGLGTIEVSVAFFLVLFEVTTLPSAAAYALAYHLLTYAWLLIASVGAAISLSIVGRHRSKMWPDAGSGASHLTT